MKNQIIIIFFGFLLLSHSQIQSQNIDNVAVHITTRQEMDESRGTGIILGYENGSSNIVYVLTSSNLIKGKETEFVDDIQVNFRNNKSKSYSATVFHERSDPSLGILVLKIIIPNDEWKNIPLHELPTIRKGKKIKQKQDVVLVGHSENNYWEINTDNFVQKPPTMHIEYGKFSISPVAIFEEFTGAPVFDSKGNLIGLVTKYTDREINCTGMEAVRAKLSIWGAPANLITAPKRQFSIDPLVAGLFLGTASVGAGYMMDLSSREKYDYYRDNYKLPSAAYPTTDFNKAFERDELYESAVFDRQLATALSIGGGVIALGGILWHYHNNRKPKIYQDIYLKRAKVKFSPGLYSSANGLSLGINMRF